MAERSGRCPYLFGDQQMLDDHYIISQARNDLNDALKALLKAEIMDATDFRKSFDATMRAAVRLRILLRESNGDEAQSREA